MRIDTFKVKAMKFRREGRLADENAISVLEEQLALVSHFPYLGLALTTTGLSFTRYIPGKRRNEKNPRLLSLSTALKLFNINISPIASYTIKLVSSHLSSSNFEDLDRLKAAYHNRVMGLHKTSCKWLVYLIADTPLFTEKLQPRFSPNKTQAYLTYRHNWEVKMGNVDSEFF